MSGGWFFIVAAEAIKVGTVQIDLPGIGSYLAMAIEQRNLSAVGLTILTMAIVILLYDQLLFRPLVAWADKFRYDTAAGKTAPTSWFLDLLRRTRVLNVILTPARRLICLPLRVTTIGWHPAPLPRLAHKAIDLLWYAMIAICLYCCLRFLYVFVSFEVSLKDVEQVATMGLVTLGRVATVVIVSSLIWVPIGVYIGLRPRLTNLVQPAAQFLAAFPANLFFPVAVIAILHFHLNPNIWLTCLIMLGTQWYVLFNVVAGASAFPYELREAGRNFHVGGWLWWRRVILPGIMPYYLTGVLTATGNAWNTTIVAEGVSWGSQKIQAYGIGAYIADMTAKGDYARILLGIAVMSTYVLICNAVLWKPLLRWSKRRFKLA
jgi:NitT/TauT family transport system permease protein